MFLFDIIIFKADSKFQILQRYISGTSRVAFTLFIKSSFSGTDNSLHFMPVFDTTAILTVFNNNHSTAQKSYTFAM
jgi:hypothetical protein